MKNKLTEAQIQSELRILSSQRSSTQNRDHWVLTEKGEITRTVVAQDFAHALLFVNSVGFLAEANNHHPDIMIQYRNVTLTLSTHDAGGLTEKDFELASKIDALENLRKLL